jgi:hypothetical protein
MKYNTAIPKEAQDAFTYLLKLTEQKTIVEVKKVSPKRTLNQNSYLHLLLGAFGQNFGYTIEEAKLIYKDLNAGIYKYDKEVRGKNHTFYRSSADITKEEMAKSIDTLHEWSKRAGYPLPPATDQEWLRQIENDIEHNQYYL